MARPPHPRRARVLELGGPLGRRRALKPEASSFGTNAKIAQHSPASLATVVAVALTVRSLSGSVFRWAADRFIVLRFVPSSGGVACLDTNQRLSRSVVKTLMLVPLGRSPGEPRCAVM